MNEFPPIRPLMATATPETLRFWADRAEKAMEWGKETQEILLERLVNGEIEIPGWTIGYSQGKRVVENGPAVLKTAMKFGVPLELLLQKMLVRLQLIAKLAAAAGGNKNHAFEVNPHTPNSAFYEWKDGDLILDPHVAGLSRAKRKELFNEIIKPFTRIERPYNKLIREDTEK